MLEYQNRAFNQTIFLKMSNIIALVTVVIVVAGVCKAPPGHSHRHKSDKSMSSESPTTPDSSGYESYRNRSIEENANQNVSFRLFGGDILLTPSQQALMEATANENDPFSPLNAVVNRQDSLWKNSLVPYVFDSSLGNSARAAIKAAIYTYETETCIRFTERTNEEDYVRFFSGEGCYSYIGRIGGEQDISIGRGCEYPGIVMHEIFHCLGRWHEQSRPDRDEYVAIRDDNIRSGFESNFEKVSSVYATTQGVPYDFRSVMHYGAYAFTRNGQPTITPKQSEVHPDDLGQRDRMSSNDLKHARALYCAEEGTSQWSEWGSWSDCSRTCNGGIRTRVRTCERGFSCAGSNIDTEDCNTQRCMEIASWSTWGEWSGCSASCGTGRQQRQRKCLNGNTCSGRAKQFRDCNTEDCPEESTWGAWGSWNTCSQTCQGGTRYRRRRCLNGNLCEGSDIETEFCNSNTSCTPVTVEVGEWSEWSRCTADCGGGTQFRTRECSIPDCTSLEQRTCNTDECDPEPELRGIQHEGCYFLPRYSYSLYFLEGETQDLTDDPITRVEPVRKCGSAAQSLGFRYFALTVGYCVSGSSNLTDYAQYPSQLDLCRGGIGGQYAGYFLMDVYGIIDARRFEASVESIVGTEEPTVETTVQTEGTTASAVGANETTEATGGPDGTTGSTVGAEETTESTVGPNGTTERTIGEEETTGSTMRASETTERTVGEEESTESTAATTNSARTHTLDILSAVIILVLAVIGALYFV